MRRALESTRTNLPVLKSRMIKLGGFKIHASPLNLPARQKLRHPLDANRRSEIIAIMFQLQVGIVTMDPTPWQLEENFQRMETHVREAVRRRAQLVIAPESVLDGYVCGADPDTTRERMLRVAQTVPDGPYLVRAGKLSKELGIYLIFGFLEKAGEELFNTCALYDPQGKLIATYRKVHPTNETGITPGRELKPFDTPL